MRMRLPLLSSSTIRVSSSSSWMLGIGAIIYNVFALWLCTKFKEEKMIIGAVKETKHQETRVALTPDIVTKYNNLGFEIMIETIADINIYTKLLEV